MSIGIFPEMLSQAILVEMIFAGTLSVDGRGGGGATGGARARAEA